MGVFILRARRPKHESFSLRRVFWLRASKIKTSTQQRVQTERRVIIITGLFKLVLVFFLTKTHKESPVIIITSLSVWYELWLDSREELYTLYSSSRVVHVSSNLSMIMLTYYIKVVYFYLLILIWATFFVMVVFMWTQIGPHLVYPLGVSLFIYNTTPCRCVGEERDCQTFTTRFTI